MKIKNKLFVGVISLVLGSCHCAQTSHIQELPSDSISLFTSSDKNLETFFSWAKDQARYYVHDGRDSVGLWYESALSGREAFCMRDVSHESVGGHLMGLQAHNQNMFMKFAENISESKDWCTYWEINRYNKPAPADYENDKEFWYNLNANFDVVQACMKMYEWTGDETYLNDPKFVNFYEKTFDKYVSHWQLGPSEIMDRPRFMHTPEPFNPNKAFHVCRGLASYVENFDGLSVSIDLIAALYAGHKAYASMLNLMGNEEKAVEYETRAHEYQKLMDDCWWNDSLQYYNTFWTTNKEFFKGEGITFVLWMDIIKNPKRINASVKDLLSGNWNVENLSHIPMILYRLGYVEDAYRYLTDLRKNKRSNYPEVSFSCVESVLSGYMGILPKASTKTLRTHLRSVSQDVASVRNVPVWKGYIDVRHNDHSESTLRNNTGESLLWEACFDGHYDQALVNGKKCESIEYETDVQGHAYTVVRVKVNNAKETSVRVL